MHPILSDYAKTYLKENLLRCTIEQKLMFKKMYTKGEVLDLPIEDVVDNMNDDQLDRAIDQVMRTIVKNLNKINKRGENKTMKIKINGITMEGDTKEIIEAAKKLGWEIPSDFKGDGDYYYSESKKELIEIKNMNEVYIKNAFLKIYRAWVKDLSGVKDLKELAQMIKDGPTDPVFAGLLSQLIRKANESGGGKK